MEIFLLKSQRQQIDILLGGKDTQKPLVEQTVNVPSQPVGDQFGEIVSPLIIADTQDFSFPAEHQHAGIQNFRQHLTDIVEFYL